MTDDYHSYHDIFSKIRNLLGERTAGHTACLLSETNYHTDHWNKSILYRPFAIVGCPAWENVASILHVLDQVLE